MASPIPATRSPARWRIANLEIIQREQPRRARPRRGRPLSRADAGASWPRIRWSARRAALGLLAAIELVPDKSSRRFFEPRGEVGTSLRDTCTRNGLVMRATRDTLIVAPPLVISQAEIDELLSKVVRSLDETAAWARAEGWL